MTRHVDEHRPGELLDAIIHYLLDTGIIDLSLRPLAKAVGSSPRGLLYHFGSKEKMLMTVLGELRKRQRTVLSQMEAKTFEEVCGNMWRHLSSPASQPHARLFFELYGTALRYPELYKEFLESAINDWLDFSAKQLQRDGYERSEAFQVATVVMAGFRGFLLDLCATQDRERIDRAVGAWLKSLDTLGT